MYMYVNVCICMYMHIYVRKYMYMYVYVCIIPIWTDEVRNPTAQRVSMERQECCTFACLVSKYMYGVACVSRIDKIIGLFSKRAL